MGDSSLIPAEIRTERLLLRPWHPDHAERLQPILVANVDYLRDWIPKHVWEPVDVPELRLRLAGYQEKFSTDVEWRFAALSLDGADILGSVGLFPRNATERAPFREADRVEIGYWIRRDQGGKGLATEATRAMMSLAQSLKGVCTIEIRCDGRNEASAAVPRRLGFQLVSTVTGASADGGDLQVWSLPIR